MKEICFINGSPQEKNSNSFFLIQKLKKNINEKECIKHLIHVISCNQSEKKEEEFETIGRADCIIFAFPLYIYCVPGLLMAFLEDYYHYCQNKTLENDAKVYAMINCAFPDPLICAEAIRVIKNFCIKTNLNWRFAIAVGSGGVLDAIKKVPVLESLCTDINNSIDEIVLDIRTDAQELIENKYMVPNPVKSLYPSNDKAKWMKAALKNGISENDLFKKPYKNN